MSSGETASAADPAQLFRAFGGSLYGTALRFLRRPEEAEDVVQDAFLVYHRSIEGTGPEGEGRLVLQELEAVAWLRRVVVNRCLDRLRHGKRWRMTEADDESLGGLGLTPAPRPADRIDLARAVAKLPENHRQVFLLHDVEGYKHREVAELLSLAEGTSKAYLFRAREALRESLEG